MLYPFSIKVSIVDQFIFIIIDTNIIVRKIFVLGMSMNLEVNVKKIICE